MVLRCFQVSVLHYYTFCLPPEPQKSPPFSGRERFHAEEMPYNVLLTQKSLIVLDISTVMIIIVSIHHYYHCNSMYWVPLHLVWALSYPFPMSCSMRNTEFSISSCQFPFHPIRHNGQSSLLWESYLELVFGTWQPFAWLFKDWALWLSQTHQDMWGKGRKRITTEDSLLSNSLTLFL